MRTEKEMLDLILSFAEEKEEIKIVGMEGSRTNNEGPKDDFQDYDITYLVTEMDVFIQDEQWLDVFGERIILQKPEAMSLYYPQLGTWFSYLMLFEDGTRIDLTLIPLEELNLYLSSDSLIKILLDKEGDINNYPVPSERYYYIEKPTPKKFDDCCNEFWWVMTYVVKGLCRKEFLYAANYLNQIVRRELYRMMEWRIGIEQNFSINVGKNYKNLEKYVSEDLWKSILSTYEMGSYEELWQALWTLQELFREASRYVATELSFEYPNYDNNISNFIQKMQKKYR